MIFSFGVLANRRYPDKIGVFADYVEEELIEYQDMRIYFNQT
jgi:hypothetical protein